NSRLDVYQIMPNHFHCIVEITDFENAGIDPDQSDSKNVGDDLRVNPKKNNHFNQGGHVGPPQPGPPQPRPPQPEPPKPGNENVGVDPRIDPDTERNDPDDNNVTSNKKPEIEPKPASMPGIVQWFKTMTTNEYILGVKEGQDP